MWNNVKCNVCENGYIYNPATCSFQNGKYCASIRDDSAITCNEIIDAEAKPNWQKQKHFRQFLMK